MRILATFCFSYAAGIFAAQYFLPYAVLLPLALFFAVAGTVTAVLWKKQRLRVALITAGLALSLAYNAVYVSSVQRPNLSLAGTQDTVTVELCDYATPTESGAKATVRILERGLRGKAVLYGDESLLSCEPGNRLCGKAFIVDASNINDNDVTTFTSKGVFLLLYARGDFTVQDGAAGTLRYLPQRLAHRMSATIESAFSARDAGVIRAILMGEKDGLSAQDYEDFSETGLLHLMAVSGLHCSFLLAMLTLLIGPGDKRLLSFLGIPLLVFYALVVGAPLSVIRACVMLAFFLLAPLFEREADGPTSLAFALFLILTHNPFAIASVGLQLSFGAMAGILLLVPKLALQIRIHVESPWLRFPLDSLALSLGASIFTMPLCAYYFGIVSLIAPIGNLLCLWMASYLFGAAFLVVAIGMLFLPAARVLAVIPMVGVRYLTAVTGVLAKIPRHAVYFTDPSFWIWLIYVYAMFFICWFVKKGKFRWLTGSLLAVASLVLVLYCNTLPYRNNSLCADILDVGQGQSVLLLSEGESALVDCGSSNSYISAGNIAADDLLNAGCTHLDYMILSHFHADHANGIETLLARVPVERIVLPCGGEGEKLREKILTLAERYGCAVEFAEEVRTVPLGNAKLQIYPALGAGSTNEEGLTVLCTSGTFDFLLTGDMDSKVEEILVQTYDLPDIEAMMVGHHGSRTSTGGTLLDTVTPEVAVISVGDNSYGHPTDAALYRLSDRDIGVYRTDMQGMVRIQVD